MTHEMTGPLIRRLRKERGMTQKDLAARLNVTDKAVSKWERDLSLPDVALLLPLAEALGVTVTELLGGAHPPDAPPPDPAGDLLSYSCRTAPQRRERLRLWLFAGVSGSFLLAAAVCWICDIVLSGKLTWSLLVDCSLGLAWGVFLPLLTFRRRAVLWALAVLSAAILPYLYVLGILLEQPAVFRLGLAVAPVAMGYLFGVYGVIRRHRRRKWYAAGEILGLSAILNFAVDLAASSLLPGGTAWGGPVVTLFLSAACFLTDGIRRRMRESAEEA